MTVIQNIYKSLLALAVVCAVPTVLAEELCATKDITTHAAHPSQSGQSSATPSGFSVVKGRRYEVALRMDGWAGVRTGKAFGWAPANVFSHCAGEKGEMAASDGSPLSKSHASSSSHVKKKENLPAKKSASESPSGVATSTTSSCTCGSGKVCVGPRGGRYCITSGGNKRYGV